MTLVLSKTAQSSPQLTTTLQEVVLSALAAFPKQIKERSPKSLITLKYPCRDLDGPIYWAGLCTVIESPAIWTSLLGKDGQIPTFGVVIGDEATVGVSAIAKLFPTDSIMHCYLLENPLQWVSGKHPTAGIVPPPTYEVRYYLLT